MTAQEKQTLINAANSIAQMFSDCRISNINNTPLTGSEYAMLFNQANLIARFIGTLPIEEGEKEEPITIPISK